MKYNLNLFLFVICNYLALILFLFVICYYLALNFFLLFFVFKI